MFAHIYLVSSKKCIFIFAIYILVDALLYVFGRWCSPPYSYCPSSLSIPPPFSLLFFQQSLLPSPIILVGCCVII